MLQLAGGFWTSVAVDGTQHAVYVDCAGRQFVFDARGRRVYGLWFRPADEALAPAPPEDTIRDTAGDRTVEQRLRPADGVARRPSPAR